MINTMTGGFNMRLGVDVGGTFTDLYSYDPETNTTFVQKAPSTPGDFKAGVLM